MRKVTSHGELERVANLQDINMTRNTPDPHKDIRI